MKYKSILVIPDLHAPFQHPDAFKFLDAVNEKYLPQKVVQLGDEVDGHTISFHQSDPDIPFSPSSELDKAIWHLKDLYVIFPRMNLIESNHGSLVYRRQKFAGLPRSVIKEWRDILEAPKNWVWSFDLTLQMSNGQYVYFHHGQSKNVLRNSQQRSMCYVQGHHHGNFEIQYWANPLNLFWAMTSGCLIDRKSLAFYYGKNNLPKPILGCSVIINGIPKLIPMTLNKKDRWIGKLNEG